MSGENIKGKAYGDWKKQEIKDLMEQLVHHPENISVLTRLGILHSEDPYDHGIALYYFGQARDISAEMQSSGHALPSILIPFAELHMQRGEYYEARLKFMQALSHDKRNVTAINGKRAAEAGINGEPLSGDIDPEKAYQGVLHTIFPEEKDIICEPCGPTSRVTGREIIIRPRLG